MSKIAGEYYFDYPSGHVPENPPYTTWSGLLAVPPDSPFAARLQNKCGGEVMTEPLIRKKRNADGTLFKEKLRDDNGYVRKNARGDDMEEEVELVIGDKGWIKGYWTSPENWPDMAAGREDGVPFSPKTHDRTRK
jgi:hypothetical protein